ncbi:26S proteasome non-ATPase regulatory subunit [Basidiobolus ranarum]|uniref:26S proteasome non-ATPase regulatory subunit n=1 Tax=Basidiobolus ranarum TaxID=34480 RepID=A0ABR2WWM4_9FUNG
MTNMETDTKPSADDQIIPMVEEKSEEQKASESSALVLGDLKHNFYLLEKAVLTTESRFTTRALRITASLRRRITSDVIKQAIQLKFPKEHGMKSKLLSYLDTSESMEVDTHDVKVSEALPEIELYIGLLVLTYLLDQKEYNKSIELANYLLDAVHNYNRRSLDQIAARIYFYHSRAYELTDRLAEIRPKLLAAQRTATLRRDDDCQATLLNLLLRNYFHYNLYDQADKLVTKTTFPESAGNNQFARYMYYLGRIKALQLDYSSSHAHLLQAIRKAPQNVITAGFQQTVHKLAIIVQLLMGEIPERSIFRQPVLRKALIPYLHITQAVRIGDLTKFQDTLAEFGKVFRADKNYTLILRLRHNVIKTGIRMISLSYSRISLRDICLKLHLDSEEDAEYIVAKAIKDGVIDATIDHENGFIKSKENVDIYSTNEPQNAFHQRISFCLDLHNDSIKAMRFPLNAHRKELESAEAARERERELAKEIEEADMDDDDDDMGDF